MEDVLAVYTRPHDPDRPLVCLDETSKQLLAETRLPIPMKAGRPARFDYEYERNGTANLFMMFAPLEGWRHVEVTDRHAAVDYAHVLKDLADVHFASAMTIVLVVARILFGLHIQGSLLQLYAVSLVFLAGALGFGLFISTLVERQQDAFQIAGIASMLPTVLLSGFIFPIRSMPVPLQVLSHAVPARYFMKILRGVILKGAPLTAYPWDVLALFAYAMLMIGLASFRLSRRRA